MLEIFYSSGSMLTTMGILSYLFNNWYMMIIGTLVLNTLTESIKSFHCKTLEHCIIVTNILFIIFGYISKQSLDYLWVAFLVCTFCILDIIKQKYMIVNEKKVMPLIGFFLLISLVFIYMKLEILTSTILWSIVLTRLLFFVNECEWL